MTTAISKLLICLIVTIIAIPAVAWQENGLLVDAGVEISHEPIGSIDDGSGGMIVAFSDQRIENEYHIYAQRMDANGNRIWAEGGVPICTYSGGNQYLPTICSDNNGGAYIVWRDIESEGSYNIYGQHINSSGNTTFAIDGTKINSSSGNIVTNPIITSGDDGSAYVVWNQAAGNLNSLQIMRLDQSGRLWFSQKEITSVNLGSLNNVVMDFTSEGATIVWDRYDAFENNLYYSTIGPDGVFVLASTPFKPDTSVYQYNSQIEADPLGGYFVCWQQYSDSGYDVYVAHVNTGGSNPGPKLLLCDLSSPQQNPFKTTVEHGVIIAWRDYRYDVWNIYAQKLTPNLNPLWTTNGVALSTGSSYKGLTKLIPDGSGGAIVSMLDTRNNSNWGIFLQRIKSTGYLAWSGGGTPITTLGYTQNHSGIISDGAGGAIVAWSDIDSYNGALMVQRLERNGYWGYPAPSIDSVEDIPGDQGGKVNLTWYSSRLDNWADDDISNYSLWRALPNGEVARASDNWQELIRNQKSAGPIVRREVVANVTYFWEFIESVDAYNLPSYSRVVSTNSDHTESNSGIHFFQVIAHGPYSGEFWISMEAQGWSIDNLAPALVAGLSGNSVSKSIGFDLQWHTNTEADLHHYEIYRGLSADFVPSVSNFVSAPTDTTFLDTEWDDSGWYYKVTAVDLHENLGEFATLATNEVSGIDSSPIPNNTALKGNFPNPFNPSTTISYDLAISGPVRLDIFETSGRLVRTLVNEEQGAGHQNVFWNGRDSNNRNLASGVYLYRLQTDEQVQSRRMTLLK